MDLDLFIEHAIDALSLGSLYALFALGIAVIFGIMRFANFAHGELIMAGAYAIVLLPLPAVLAIPSVLVLVVVLALAIERIGFRPVRAAGAPTLLITSFALSFLLQHIASLSFGSRPRTTGFATALGGSFTVAGFAVKWLDVVIIGVTLSLLAGVGLFLQRTLLGVQMRASAEDIRLARAIGVRGNTVLATAFALSGILAAVAAILLTAQTSTVSPTIGLNIVLLAFVATIIGGMGSLSGAVVGGFALGAVTVALQASLPLELRPFRDALVFASVLALLVVRPQGLMPARSSLAREVPRSAGPRELLRRIARQRSVQRAPGRDLEADEDPRRGLGPFLGESVWPLAALVACTCAIALIADALGSDSLDRVVLGAVIDLTVVVGLYMFVGISGVFSFGHAAFMAIGAYTGAILVIPPETKRFVLPELPGVLARVQLDPLPATLAAGAVAAAFALLVSFPLARLSGLTAGLATFAVLSIVNVVARNWDQLTHGTAGVSGIPTTTTLGGALAWAAAAMASAWIFQRSRTGLRLRASREDESAARAIGVAVGRERAVALVLSAFFVGAAGALFGMFIGSFNPDAFFLDITFLMLVMLVIGGTTSLAGAVIGTLVISTVSELLRRLEEGADLGVLTVPGRTGLRDVGLALALLAILIFRPAGVTGGRELAWPRRSRTAAR